ncbi:right-handed parallel beta-helix repeat-containing protein [bacterium]|nr:right-handed parallel beta-helix repeat-containing protein [bacterium]
MAGLLAAGCGSDGSFDFSNFTGGGGNPIQAVPPTAVADAFAVFGNGELVATVTANDTVNGAVVTQFQNVGTAGGTVQIAANGQLTYTPPLNQSNIVDTFTYTLGNTAGTSTATVTITIGARGFFVNNLAPAGGTGSQANPFNTLAAAVAAANGVNGAQIILFRGDGTSAGLNTPVPLQANQGISSLDPASQATITGPVTLIQGNRVANLRVFGTAGAAVNGTGAVNGTVQGVTVANCTGDAIVLNNGTGNWTVNECAVQNSGLQGCTANCTTGILNWVATNCTFTNNTFGDTVVNVTGTASQNVTVQNCVVNQSRAQLMVLRGDSGNVGLNLTNNTVNGGGVTLRGLNALTQGTLQLSGRVTGNNITGCTQDGIALQITATSRARVRFNQNRTLGNLAGGGFSTAALNNSDMGLAITNNTFDVLALTQTNPALFQVEQFGNLTNTLGNTGAVQTVGTIQDVAAGSLGIP